MKTSFHIDRALTDKRLLGAALGDIHTWQIWRTVLKAAFGLELNREEARAFASVAGSRAPPAQRVRELWAIIGRRGGKSRMAAAIACYVALFIPHKLAVGEIGTVLVIAASIDQAKTVFEYVKGFLEASPTLRKEIVNIKRNEIELKNGIVISVHSNSFRTVRGRTLVACIFDEVAFWKDETSAVPDQEMYRAILPSLATTNGLLVGISTPYRKSGLLHERHRNYFGINDDDVLVVQGSSKQFNPSLSDKTIANQRLADPTSASSEWDAEFRSDMGSCYDNELVQQSIDHARPMELPPQGGYAWYQAFVDASGGVGNDAYTIAIGHKEDDGHFVIDLVRGTPAGQIFDPHEVTKEYAALCREYGIEAVTGDAYAAQWVAGAWQEQNIAYQKSDLPKSQIYLECIPLFSRGLLRLPDHAKLIKELCLLERHTHRSGKDSVDHPRNGHDDFANVCCGVLRLLSNYLGYDLTLNYISDPDDGNDSNNSRAYAARQLNDYLTGMITLHNTPRPYFGRRW